MLKWQGTLGRVTDKVSEENLTDIPIILSAAEAGKRSIPLLIFQTHLGSMQ